MRKLIFIFIVLGALILADCSTTDTISNAVQNTSSDSVKIHLPEISDNWNKY